MTLKVGDKTAKESRYFIGIMTGTSVDAIDAVLVKSDLKSFRIIDGFELTIDDDLRGRVSRLFQPGDNEIDQLGELDRELGLQYASAISTLLERNSISATSICAIGCHGQTIRHRPSGTEQGVPFTLQIGDANTIAATTNIITIADFRRKDIALGGQGAPLAPAFHQYICQQQTASCAVVNIGGIANISLIANEADASVTGFDTGPGNGLMDAWITRHKHQKFDNNGEWAASGKVNEPLLDELLLDPYFSLPLPKSTGKEYFNIDWLDNILAHFESMAVEDVQATLCELTARSISHVLSQTENTVAYREIYICGGGLKNTHLMNRLAELLPEHTISSSEALNIHPDHMEAAAFAWLAQQTLDQLPGSRKGVTGARRDAILGGIYLP